MPDQDLLESIREQIAALPNVSGVDPSSLDCRPIKQLVESFKNFGFQASNLAAAVEIINQMIAVRNAPFNPDQLKSEHPHFFEMVPLNHFKPLTIILSYTSNMVSCGNREIIRFLVQHNLVDCIVTTAGGIEEDFVKCIAPTKSINNSLNVDDSILRQLFMNRINNLLVPSDNYTSFEDWVMPLFSQMHDDQMNNGTIYSPSKLIHFLGSSIDDPSSIYYWTSRNNIPVFCPALTDGAIGDMLYFYSIKNNHKTSPFILDTLSDLVHLNNLAKFSVQRGIIVLGGGVVKHHTCNACLMANGADYAVFVNTGIEYDGSDSGAPPSEAVSWGKIKSAAPSVKVFGDASILFAIIVCASDFISKSNK